MEIRYLFGADLGQKKYSCVSGNRPKIIRPAGRKKFYSFFLSIFLFWILTGVGKELIRFSVWSDLYWHSGGKKTTGKNSPSTGLVSAWLLHNWYELCLVPWTFGQRSWSDGVWLRRLSVSCQDLGKMPRSSRVLALALSNLACMCIMPSPKDQ